MHYHASCRWNIHKNAHKRQTRRQNDLIFHGRCRSRNNFLLFPVLLFKLLLFKFFIELYVLYLFFSNFFTYNLSDIFLFLQIFAKNRDEWVLVWLVESFLFRCSDNIFSGLFYSTRVRSQSTNNIENRRVSGVHLTDYGFRYIFCDVFHIQHCSFHLWRKCENCQLYMASYEKKFEWIRIKSVIIVYHAVFAYVLFFR